MKDVNIAPHNTDYNISDLNDFFGDGWKAIRKQIQKRNIYLCKKYYTVWNLVSW